MSVTREARYLSGADRGKHVSLTVPGSRFGDWALAGELVGTRHWGDGTVDILVKWDGESRGPRIANHLPPETPVIITGKVSPAIGPDCQSNKHRACDGRALDEATDDIVACQCTCHN